MLGAVGKGLLNVAKKGGSSYGKAFKKNWKGTLGKTVAGVGGVGGGLYVAGSDIAKGTRVNTTMPRQRGGYHSPYGRV